MADKVFRTADILQGRPQAVNASKNNYNARIYIVIRKFYVQMQNKDIKRNIAKGTTDPGVDYFDQ